MLNKPKLAAIKLAPQKERLTIMPQCKNKNPIISSSAKGLILKELRKLYYQISHSIFHRSAHKTVKLTYQHTKICPKWPKMNSQWKKTPHFILLEE